MSDDNDSGGIIGTIFGLILLAVLWPYLLALLGIWIAYMALVTIFNWIAQNLAVSLLILLGCLAVVCAIRYRWIPRAYRYLVNYFAPKPTAVSLSDDGSMEGMPNLDSRQFIPSTNLYCYWCTKKLGIQAFELGGKYYCAACNAKQKHSLK